jgi:cell division transport system permease protein
VAEVAISVDYVARETAANLWRNRLMTVAAVLTVAVSLALVGAALLLKQGVSTATIQWRGGVTLSVYLQPNVTGNQRTAIGHELLTDPRVKSIRYVNQSEAYAEMQKLFANQPDLVNSVTPKDLPPSYRVVLRNASQAPEVGDEFSSQPGVKQVQYPGQEIQTMLRVTNVLQIIFFSVAVVLLLSASVLILNAIRMAIFARRREVAVMKLVGATNWFIRIPFMLEGFFQGLVGAIAASGLVVFLHWLLDYAVQHDNVKLLQSLVVTGHDVLLTIVVVLVVGSIVGAIGSGLAVRRFLEV